MHQKKLKLRLIYTGNLSLCATEYLQIFNLMNFSLDGQTVEFHKGYITSRAFEFAFYLKRESIKILIN